MVVSFDLNEAGTKLFAVFISQLIREGVTFVVETTKLAYHVTLTGGW